MADKKSVLEKYPAYEATIGIEVHVQLNTESKIFCSCKNQVTPDQNTNICEICTAQPGALPVLNKEVVTNAIKAGLATNCTINQVNEFARKHYFYPDLPKGYQTTQDDKPICVEGYVPIRLEDGSIKKIRLIRIHMEEDAGKNIHSSRSNKSYVNLNRAGTPLLEIVSYPDIANSYEAKAYLKALHNIVMYLGITTGNMEEGAFRADTNISVKQKEATELGTRCEMKNINSFKFIGDAVDYEIERQIKRLERGENIRQETRLWDTSEHKTKSMRGKEEAADYRYFPDPDLPIIKISDEWIDSVKNSMPELPEQKLNRLQQDYKLSQYEADILIDNPAIADYYETAAKIIASKHVINFVLRDIMGLLKEKKVEVSACPISPENLANLVQLLENNTINSNAAKKVFELMIETGEEPAVLVEKHGLKQMTDTGAIEAMIVEIIEQNPKQVAAYKGGKDKLFGFFVGQAMAKTKGRANPKVIQELLKKHLA